MEYETLSSELSVSAQIQPSDIAVLRTAGFNAIICNRPDGEAEDQPEFAEIQEVAAATGIETRYVPVLASGVTPENVLDFGSALKELPHPVLAYCRSGKRSATLWSRLTNQSPQDE